MNDKHFQLLAFLITSARGCIDEPKLYGPLRLLDAATKLIEIMEEEGKTTPEIVELQRLIDEKKDLVMYDEEAFVKFLDELSKRLAKIIKNSKST